MMNIRKLLINCLRFSGLPFLARHLIQRNKVTILLYHDLSKEAALYTFTHLKKLYNIISLQDYIYWNQNGETKKIPSKALIITFDDGHKRNYELLDVVHRLEIPVTIFLCSAIVGTNRGYWFYRIKDNQKRKKIKELPEKEFIKELNKLGIFLEAEQTERQALDISELEEMKKSQYIDFQSHTRFHYMLPKCGDDLARNEIIGSKNELESKFGLKINTLSYPNGEYSTRDMQMAQSAGYCCLLTVHQKYNKRKQDLMKLNRISMNDASNYDEVIVRASGIWAKILNR